MPGTAPSCGRDSFPRTDPAVIVLVTHGDRCLLGRSPRFPPGMYSTLAGFVEPGESLEQTLRREVFEEVGVVLDEVAYRASQPWPFPQSLMLGFRATALSMAMTLGSGRDRGCAMARTAPSSRTRAGARCACRTVTASPAS